MGRQAVGQERRLVAPCGAMRVVIYTALYGGHSTLKEFDEHGYRCVCFTDDAWAVESSTWEQRKLIPPTCGPRYASKIPKMLNPLASEADATIWIDSTITLTNTRLFVATCLAALEGREIALFKHPERTNVHDEAVASSEMPKYAGQRILEQARLYRDEGLPDDHVLYAGGVIARSAPMPRFGERWLREMNLSLQDQVSLPYVLWREGIVPGVIPGNVYGSEFHTHRWEGPDR